MIGLIMSPRMNSKNKIACLVPLLAALSVSFSAHSALAAEVDFSCMKERVRGIIQVSDRYKEYDIIMRNQCPGAVYWSMCIERLDPWTHKTLETHNPTGMIEAEKKARVNIQMKKTPNAANNLARFQEFYVNFDYAINQPAKASCIASQCEAKKRTLRAQLSANGSAWQQAEQALADRIGQACPDTGWESAKEDCEKEILEANQEKMDAFAQKDEALKQQMADIDPELCEVHGGKLAPD